MFTSDRWAKRGVESAGGHPRVGLRRRSSNNSETVRNITVSVDDDTYRRARMKAAEQDTSLSALVKRFLIELASTESQTDQLKREEKALRTRITAFSAANRLSRDEAHARDR